MNPLGKCQQILWAVEIPYRTAPGLGWPLRGFTRILGLVFEYSRKSDASLPDISSPTGVCWRRNKPAALLASLAAIVWVLILAASPVLANEARLGFSIGGKSVASFGLDELGAYLKARDLSLFDPEYGKQKHYLAYALGDVMRLGLGQDWAQDPQADVVFQAMDGYRSVSPVSLVDQDGGFLAIRDLDVEGWEPIGRMQANPAPFYVVWTGAEQTTQHGYPWPWQLASIELAHFNERYPEVPPKGAVPDSPASRGFRLFKQRCVRCHSINGQGGTIGPDLNAPMGILTYRSIQTVKEFIRHPSIYRHTRMPDHTDLSDDDLDDLIAYFWHKSQEARPE